MVGINYSHLPQKNIAGGTYNETKKQLKQEILATTKNIYQ